MHRKDTITLAGAVICLLLIMTGCLSILDPSVSEDPGIQKTMITSYQLG